MTVNFGDAFTNEMDFTREEGKIVSTVDGPRYDDDGKEVEGENLTSITTYVEKK